MRILLNYILTCLALITPEPKQADEKNWNSPSWSSKGSCTWLAEKYGSRKSHSSDTLMHGGQIRMEAGRGHAGAETSICYHLNFSTRSDLATQLSTAPVFNFLSSLQMRRWGMGKQISPLFTLCTFLWLLFSYFSWASPSFAGISHYGQWHSLPYLGYM